MRQYKKSQRQKEQEEEEEKGYQLPRVGAYWETQGALQEWEKRIPEEFSSPSKARYKETLHQTQVLLARGSIQEMESLRIRNQFNEEAKRKLHSR